LRPAQFLELTLLAALWGGSFLFMRVAVPEFGPVTVSALRVSIAAVTLALFIAASGGFKGLRADILPLCVVGVLNAALPFALFAFAMLHLTAGFASILNATAPFFSAIVAYLWLRERLTPFQVVGLAVGFAGVALLLWGTVSFGDGPIALAVTACLLATLSYGVAANYVRRRLLRAGPMATAAGSQIAAALCLLPPTLWLHPTGLPSPQAWLAVAALDRARLRPLLPAGGERRRDPGHVRHLPHPRLRHAVGRADPRRDGDVQHAGGYGYHSGGNRAHHRRLATSHESQVTSHLR
jgi:drug/metabolite transporter (DMT)-like permease